MLTGVSWRANRKEILGGEKEERNVEGMVGGDGGAAFWRRRRRRRRRPEAAKVAAAAAGRQHMGN